MRGKIPKGESATVTAAVDNPLSPLSAARVAAPTSDASSVVYLYGDRAERLLMNPNTSIWFSSRDSYQRSEKTPINGLG